MRASVWMMAALVIGVAACEQEDPCGEYVDYICDCHADDGDFDCDELRSTYENADASVEDECAIALDEQEEADAANGVDCAV